MVSPCWTSLRHCSAGEGGSTGSAGTVTAGPAGFGGVLPFNCATALANSVFTTGRATTGSCFGGSIFGGSGGATARTGGVGFSGGVFGGSGFVSGTDGATATTGGLGLSTEAAGFSAGVSFFHGCQTPTMIATTATMPPPMSAGFFREEDVDTPRGCGARAFGFTVPRMVCTSWRISSVFW